VTEYIGSVVTAALLVTVGGLAAYGSGAVARTSRAAMAILLLYAVSVPVLALIPDFNGDDVGSLLDDFRVEIGEDDALYYERTVKAYGDGVRALVCDKFSLDGEDVEVTVTGLDFEKMRAERVLIVLSGSAVYADARRIAETVEDAELGECEVRLEI